MTLKHLSELWTAIAPALGNHLWQSTLFAVVAGLLTLALRKNQARYRFGLWLAASLKFLIPFSWLVAIGSRISWAHNSAPSQSAYIVMAQVTEPFAHPAIAANSVYPPPNSASLSPAVLTIAWACGFAAVVSIWCLRWRRVSANLRRAVPMHEGKEVEALRRMECALRMPKRVEMFLSHTSLEPGVFGIAKPVLLWPAGISAHLDDLHLEAVLAHELRHVCRRDNLAALLHMLVASIFWFHPLVWWVGARLVEERERACDEEVLASGSHRQIYAESILKVCEFCVGSPLACVSGVTGSDLKKRMVHIMTEHIPAKLSLRKKLFLSTVGLLAVAIPVVFGLIDATPSYAQVQSDTGEASAIGVVSIKPAKPVNGMVMNSLKVLSIPDVYVESNSTLQSAIETAYGVKSFQIAGAPEWLRSEKYDIEAKVGTSVAERLNKLTPEQRTVEMQRMLQTLLVDRLKLTLHRETRQLPDYSLTVAPEGSKLHETGPDGKKGPNGQPITGLKVQILAQSGLIASTQAPIGVLVNTLSDQLGNPVTDNTGLTGHYDFTLQWSREPSSPFESLESSISTALEQQLGLNLKSHPAPTEIIVIDHAEKPVMLGAADSQAESRLAMEPRQEFPTHIHVSEEVMRGLIRNKVPPQYPETALKEHITGTVILNTTVNEKGNIEDVHLASGPPLLASAAINAVRQWTYQPYMLNGGPVPVETQVHVTFSLSPKK